MFDVSNAEFIEFNYVRPISWLQNTEGVLD